jgi:hypothetical protein
MRDLENCAKVIYPALCIVNNKPTGGGGGYMPLPQEKDNFEREITIKRIENWSQK